MPREKKLLYARKCFVTGIQRLEDFSFHFTKLYFKSERLVIYRISKAFWEAERNLLNYLSIKCS